MNFGVAAAIVAALVIIPSGLHQINEGHVGVYWRGGALLSHVSHPGFNLKAPLVTSLAQIQVTVQTDSITDIPCGTSGGVLIHFAKVEVVNQLQKSLVYATIKNYTVNYDKTWIFDKIHHEINQFCSRHTLQEVYIDLFDTLDENLQKALQRDCNIWAPGIQIIAVRVTKPRIPEQIRSNYEQMEGQKTQLLIETQRQKVTEKIAETERKKATIEAMQKAEVSKIEMARSILEQETQQEIHALQDSIHLAQQKSISDAANYKMLQQAEANKMLLTPQFIEYTRILSISNNTKIYFGENMPSMFVEHKDSKSL